MSRFGEKKLNANNKDPRFARRLKNVQSSKKTMQIRPKKGITYKIQKKTPKISESHQNTTDKREKHMKLVKTNRLRSKK